MKSPEDTKPESWHRFFGSTANNAAWDLAERPAGQESRRELLNAAHAAAWHWQQVGTELNRMRALLLLALAHAQAGLGDTALAYAEEVKAYFLAAPDTPDWETAFVHVVHAHAAWTAGAKERYAQSYSLALQAMAAIKGEEDRNVVQRVFRHVPTPEREAGQ